MLSIPFYGPRVSFAREKKGSLRLCIGYRELHMTRIKNKYPLPRVNHLFNQLQVVRLFSKNQAGNN